MCRKARRTIYLLIQPRNGGSEIPLHIGIDIPHKSGQNAHGHATNQTSARPGNSCVSDAVVCPPRSGGFWENAMKTCFKCGEAKPLAQFYKHPMMSDGHLGKCKECAKRDTKKHYRDTFKVRQAYERHRFAMPKRKADVKRYQEKRRKDSPLKYAARYAVCNAIRAGRLKRQPCEICSKKAQAHHEDYSKPLDVQWLCFKCHRKHHGQLQHETT